MSPTEREQFSTHCAAAAEAARVAGVIYGKVPGQCAIAVSGNGAQASTFPIVTDVGTWQQTTPDEAFFVVLVDVHAWAIARLDEAKLAKLVELDSRFRELKREYGEQLANLRTLAAHAGGMTGLKTLWSAAGLDVAWLDGLALS